MKKSLLIVSFISLFLLGGCNGSNLTGNNVSKDYPLEPYTELSVSSAFDVYVSKEARQMTISTDEAIMPYVIVETEGDRLIIRLKPLCVNFNGDMKVTIPFNPDLQKVDLSGASEFHSDIPMNARKMELELSGASDFYGSVFAEELDLEISGASSAYLEGQVGTLKIDLSGAGHIKEIVKGDRYALSCDNCTGSLSGASDAYIHCDGTLRLKLSGASDLYYTGNGDASGCTATGASEIVHETLVP